MGHALTVELLVQKNASIDLLETTEERLTPLDQAILGDHSDCIELLLHVNAKQSVNIMNRMASKIQKTWRSSTYKSSHSSSLTSLNRNKKWKSRT